MPCDSVTCTVGTVLDTPVLLSHRSIAAILNINRQIVLLKAHRITCQYLGSEQATEDNDQEDKSHTTDGPPHVPSMHSIEHLDGISAREAFGASASLQAAGAAPTAAAMARRPSQPAPARSVNPPGLPHSWSNSALPGLLRLHEAPVQANMQHQLSACQRDTA